MKKMNPVIHFEMRYDGAKRLTGFYSDVFGWQTQVMDAKLGNYVLATTTESDEKGPKKPGAIQQRIFHQRHL